MGKSPFFIIRKGANFLFHGGCAEFPRSYHGLSPKMTAFVVIIGAKFFNNRFGHFFHKNVIFGRYEFNIV